MMSFQVLLVLKLNHLYSKLTLKDVKLLGAFSLKL